MLETNQREYTVNCTVAIISSIKPSTNKKNHSEKRVIMKIIQSNPGKIF